MKRKSKPTQRPSSIPRSKDDLVDKKQDNASADEELVAEESDLDNSGVEDVIEPDDESLAQQEEELDDDEDILDVKKTPQLAAELSEDPVRLYLREIGQVKLLDADSEFRLATLIEADRLIDAFSRRPQQSGATVSCNVYRAVVNELLTSWERLEDDAERMQIALPDPSLVLTEAQHLQLGWQIEEPSYLRAYLD